MRQSRGRYDRCRIGHPPYYVEHILVMRPADRILLIGWDAADWKIINPLLENGHMPNLQGLINRGGMGNLRTLQPVLSPILWTSIVTGKCADKHGILGFVEPDEASGRLRPVTSSSRACKALWNLLSQNGLRSAFVGWFASHPAEQVNGCIVTDYFIHSLGSSVDNASLRHDVVHPRGLFDTMAALRVRPDALTPGQVLPFVPNAARVDQDRDRRLAILAGMLAECATVQNVATWLAENETWDLLGVYYSAIDRFGHAFMPYHPPCMDHINQSDFEIYQHVVTSCYRFHDMMLGRLLELCGPQTTVMIVSDHGFHSDHLRPRVPPPDQSSGKARRGGDPVAWHRNYGVLVVGGPHIKRDERVYGATLLDIAPTILGMLGLPIPKDMDGKPLSQILDTSVQFEAVDSYEDPHPADGIARDQVAVDPWAAQQMLQRLADMGYIDPPTEDSRHALEQASDDRMRNLAQVHFSAGHIEESLRIYQGLLERKDSAELRIHAAQCLLRLGREREAAAQVETVVSQNPDAPFAHLLLGIIDFESGRVNAALDHLGRAEQANPRLPDLHCRLGQAYLRLRRWEDAGRSFQLALDIDGDSPLAHDGLGVALRHMGRSEDAVYEHMRSISLLHHRPATHFHLGLALAQVRQFDWAIRAFQVSAELAPRNPLPHRCLARLYARAKKDPSKAREHVRVARSLAKEWIASARARRSRAKDSREP